MAQYGLEPISPYPSEYVALENWLDPFSPTPFHKNVELVGYGGIGIDWPHFLDLYPVIPFCILYFLARTMGKRYVFPAIAQLLGIKATKVAKTRKFCYQMWLFTFYCLSSTFGFLAQHDKKWLGFPMNKVNMMALFENFPSQPDTMMTIYYSSQLAFYFTELVAIMMEDRRADFVEYVVHHITATILVLMSYGGHEHPMGAYILLLHDVSDIFLCAAKILHYANMEVLTNINFVFFIGSFFFLRLVCLPVNFIPTFYIAPLVRKACINYWLLTVLLYGSLQMLHVYWFVLILKMIYRLFKGVKGDMRSDSDDDGSKPKEKKKKK